MPVLLTLPAELLQFLQLLASHSSVKLKRPKIVAEANKIILVLEASWMSNIASPTVSTKNTTEISKLGIIG